jgi:hypothetical protein
MLHAGSTLEETMGDTQVGGNLSVHWLVNADEVDPVDEETYIRSSRPGTGRGFCQYGVDYHNHKSGGCGDDFTVRIKLPKDADKFIADVVKGLKRAKARGRLEFALPIEKSPTPHTQIQVAWAGAQQRASVPKWSDGLSQPGGPGKRGRGRTVKKTSSRKGASGSSKKAT